MEIFRRPPHHPIADDDDHAGLLEKRNETARPDDTGLGIGIAQQGLQAHQPAVGSRDLRLVVHVQGAPLDGLAQLGLHGDRVDNPFVHRRIVQ
ncbi:MAG: hypothetical protein ACD_75C02522G0001 [uncultured bacterium]|nr:MAG: hypothetical protein ACD_75C02522G0001 [uncultured bacterium]